MFEKLKQKNILYLTHTYRTFQKDPIEEASGYFNAVTVLVRYKPIAEISRIIPISFFKPHTKAFAIQDKIKPENVSVIPIPVWYFPDKKGYEKLGEKHFQKVIREIKSRSIKFDLIHAHMTWTSGYVAYRLKKEMGIPYVLTVHEEDRLLKEEIDSGNSGIFDTWANADKLLRVNKVTLPLLRKYNENVEYNAPGFNSDIFYPKDGVGVRKVLGLPLDKKIILNIGNLEIYKGQEVLIQAISKIKYMSNNCLFIIMGEGSRKSEIIKLIKKYDLDDVVRLEAGKPHKEICDWMNACDVFALPSLGEGTPAVMLEAMACGKPVVGTNISGIPEVIKSGEYGLVCEAGNPASLSEALEKSLNVKWNSHIICEYISQYTVKKLNERLLQIYSDLAI